MKKTSTTKDGLIRIKPCIFLDTKTGFYRYRFEANGVDYEKVIGPHKEAAEAALAEAKQTIKLERLAGQGFESMQKLLRSKKQITFAKAAADYIEENPQFKPSTIAAYESILKTHLLPRFGNQVITEITRSEIQKFQASLLKSPTRGGKKKNLAPRRINSIMELFRTIMKRQYLDGNLLKDPTTGVPRLPEDKAKIDPLSSDELIAAFSAVDPHYKSFFELMSLTGARPNELQALRWRDVDWKKSVLDINKGRVRGKEGKPKTKAGERLIPLNHRAVQILRELKDSRVTSHDGYVFTKPNGQPIDKHLDRIWARGLSKAGLRHRPFYQLRHTFATHSLLASIPLPLLAKILGHSTIDPLLRNYAGWIEDNTAHEVAKLNDLYTDKKTTEPSREIFRESSSGVS